MAEQATASFIGSRWRLAGILISGYILMLPTLGIYRFWQVTQKRRFYWSHTEIDGDGLEYTGTAIQLLVGFLFALAIFLPLYGFFFYLSTQSPEALVYGYTGAALLLFFLSGYAIYRARRFRLTRTLWRGIRFHQSGSAWAYAFRRILWFAVTVATAGLAYPFMAASLWKYRYNNTWYGDRRFSFEGSWRTIAAPFYVVYFLVAGLTVAITIAVSTGSGLELGSQQISSEALVGILSVALAIIVLFSYFYLLSRFTSRLLSKVTAGAASLKVRVRARSLFWQYFFYALLVLFAVTAFLLAVGFVLQGVLEPMLADQEIELSEILQVGWYNLVMLGLLYLAFMALLTVLSETILGLGFWRLVARGTIVENSDSLKSVRAGGEESPLAGEGLADALNVGGY